MTAGLHLRLPSAPCARLCGFNCGLTPSATRRLSTAASSTRCSVGCFGPTT
jgi:hypothetical protein